MRDRAKYKKMEFSCLFSRIKVKVEWDLLIFPNVVGLRLNTRIKEGIREVRIISVGYVVETVYEKEGI